MNSAPLIILAAGETSGDLLGAGLIQALQQLRPGLRFAGIGGPAMASTGMDCWHNVAELSVMGLAEVARHLPRLLHLRRRFRQRILLSQPALYIGIDAPDFNFPLEARLSRAGVHCVHYVSPSVWAWRPQRVWRIAAACKHLLCLFPFEPNHYAATGLNCTVVGHPRADEIPADEGALEQRRQRLRHSIGLKPKDEVIALLPGSRNSERQRLWPLFLETALLYQQARQQQLSQQPSGNQDRRGGAPPQTEARLVFVSAQADHIGRAFLSDYQQRHHAELTIKLLDNVDQALLTCDTVLAASGTVTLEALFYHRPQVATYRLNKLTYQLVKYFNLMRSPWLTLPNALAGAMLIPEIFQEHATAQRLCQELLRWRHDKRARANYQEQAQKIHQALRLGAHQAAAQAIIKQLDQ